MAYLAVAAAVAGAIAWLLARRGPWWSAAVGPAVWLAFVVWLVATGRMTGWWDLARSLGALAVVATAFTAVADGSDGEREDDGSAPGSR